MVGYDAMTVGNHEFDFGYDNYLNCKQLNFPIVSSNIYKMANVYLILQQQ